MLQVFSNKGGSLTAEANNGDLANAQAGESRRWLGRPHPRRGHSSPDALSTTAAYCPGLPSHAMSQKTSPLDSTCRRGGKLGPRGADVCYGSLADIGEGYQGCPLYPQKRTCSSSASMSAMCGLRRLPMPRARNRGTCSRDPASVWSGWAGVAAVHRDGLIVA